MPSPQRGSNTQFVAGGLYPGGNGVIKDIGYKLWDYNGKQPTNSQMCVEAIFTPIDGSNDGKDVVINWNVGGAENYQPDPSAVSPGSDSSAFYLDMKGTSGKLSDSSNWHFAYQKGLVENCGMPIEQLDGPTGLKCLIGTELTLVRMEPPKRDFANNPPPTPAPGQPQQRKNEILVPTRAKFSWEKPGTRAARPTQSTTAPTAATASPAVSAASTSNGSSDLSSLVASIVSSSPEGYIEMSIFNDLLLAAINEKGIKGKSRIALLRESKDAALMSQIAANHNFLLEDFTVKQDGTMTGTMSTQ